MGSAENFLDTALLQQSWDSSTLASAVPRELVSNSDLRFGPPEEYSTSRQRPPTVQLNGHAPGPNEITPEQLAELKAILRKRDLLVDKRVSLNDLKRNCVPYRNHNQEAIKACQDAVRSWRASIRSGQANDDAFSVLEKACERLERSCPGLLGIEEQVRQAEIELNALESHFQKRENKLYNKWKKLVDGHESVDSVPSDSEDGSAHSTRSTRASSSPSLAREYYLQAKQAFILRSRLREFQEEQRQAEETRNHDQDLNQQVEPSEKASPDTYFTELTAMYKEFFDAQERATQLKAQCRQFGIDVEDERDTTSNIEALNGQTHVERSVIHQAAMSKSGSQGVNSFEELLFGYTDSNARVEEWFERYQQNEPTNINLNDQTDLTLG